MRCPACGTVMLWQAAKGPDQLGQPEGKYYCPKCDNVGVDVALRREDWPRLPGFEET